MPELQHIAIIMDGNGRWAHQRFLPRIEGHKASRSAIRCCIEGCLERKIPYLSLYAFSIENWKRPKKEISALFLIFNRFITDELDELHAKNVNIFYSGQVHRFPEYLQKTLLDAKHKTKHNSGLYLNICLDYSGKNEIIRAVKTILKLDINPEELNEELFEKYLDTGLIPPVDLMIRTSGEMRLSNFMLWQIAYSEMVFLEKNWPDFTIEDLIHCIEIHQQRKRRFGAL